MEIEKCIMHEKPFRLANEQDELDLAQLGLGMVNDLSGFDMPNEINSDHERLLDDSDSQASGSTNGLSDQDSDIHPISVKSSPILIGSYENGGFSRTSSVSIPCRRAERVGQEDVLAPDPFPELSPPVDGKISGEKVVGENKARLSFGETPGHTHAPSEQKVTIKVCKEDGSSKETEIDRTTTAHDLCLTMVEKNHVTDGINWAIVEQISEAGLERVLEDHEWIADVYKFWQANSKNQLLFRKNFTKYGMFQNPSQYLPAVTNDSDGRNGNNGKDSARNLLLQNMMSIKERSPSIQGLLNCKDGKKSWKKNLVTLRSGNLYCSPQKSLSIKEHKQMQSFVALADYNVYMVSGGKKKYNAPTDYTLCFKPNNRPCEARDLKFLCMADERTKQNWLSNIRLAKCGKQLSKNYQAAKQRQKKENSSNSSVDSDRVALDFTNKTTRVVDDPDGRAAVVKLEGNQWRHKNVESPRGSPRLFPSSPRYSYFDSPHIQQRILPSSLDSSHGSPHFRKGGMESGIHTTQPWFHGSVPRAEAEELMMEHGLIDGLFLVRESQTYPGSYVLTFSHNQKIIHYTIRSIEVNGKYYVTLDQGGTKFSDLIQLVEFYQINSGGLPTKLMHYCTRI